MEEACEMPTYHVLPKDVEEILTSNKTIAIVGLSPKEDRASNRVAKYLQSQGYKIIPVNPQYPEILGLKSYAKISDIPEEIDVVDIFRKSSAVPEIVDDAIKKGVKVVWMQEGIIHNESAKKVLEAGIKVVMNKCMMKEYKKLMTTKKANE
jgi:predicted CoA-binding protein